MKILVTGANGMLARAAIEWCISFGDAVTGLTRGEFDIRNRARAISVVGDLRPDAVINCAAFTDVDGSETDRETCFATNARGVENLAIACRRSDAAFVTISTDYVFDGTNRGFYTQRDMPNPLGVYAKSKREGEIRAFAAYPRSIIVRSGWIYGAHGTNFLSVVPKLLAEGRSIDAIADSYGTPTFAGDLAARLRELAEADLPGVYHATNSGPGCSYLEFAQKVCEIGGFDSGLLHPASHVDLQRPAPRPVSSKLACAISEKLGFAPMRNWDEALAAFLGRG